MLTITLPDGAERQVEEGTLPRDVVASIGPRLLRDALAVEVDGEILDLATPLRKGGAFKVLTAKDRRGVMIEEGCEMLGNFCLLTSMLLFAHYHANRLNGRNYEVRSLRTGDELAEFAVVQRSGRYVDLPATEERALKSSVPQVM